MNTQTGSSRDSGYQHALSILAAKGVFKENPLNRDGHTSAVFDGSEVDITGSQLTQREVSEEDRMRLFGHLLAVAIERGLRPVELLAIGMATTLQKS
jgi:hypothetical protein